MKAAAKADAADAEPEPVPQYDALLAEEVSLAMRRQPSQHSTLPSRQACPRNMHRIMRSAFPFIRGYAGGSGLEDCR